MNKKFLTATTIVAAAVSFGPVSASPVERTVSIDLEYSCQGAVGTVSFTGDAATVVATSYVPGEAPVSDALVDVEPGTYPAGTAPYPSGTVVTSWVSIVATDGVVITSLTQGVIPDGC